MSKNIGYRWQNSIKQNYEFYEYLQFYLLENDSENTNFNSDDCGHT
jgi:hypothetical protein